MNVKRNVAEREPDSTLKFVQGRDVQPDSTLKFVASEVARNKTGVATRCYSRMLFSSFEILCHS